MSNKPGRDGLHPNEQGSMVIANNLARAMGLPGRTAGLSRASADSWNEHSRKSRLKPGQPCIIRQEPFSREKGYSVQFPSAHTGKAHLELTLGDEAGSGKLLISPENISWGDKTLYCFPADSPTGKKRSRKGALRVVWHPGLEGNRPQGYYVWLDKQLIGQSLPAGEPVGAGCRIQAVGGSVALPAVMHADEAFAPEN